MISETPDTAVKATPTNSVPNSQTNQALAKTKDAPAVATAKVPTPAKASPSKTKTAASKASKTPARPAAPAAVAAAPAKTPQATRKNKAAAVETRVKETKAKTKAKTETAAAKPVKEKKVKVVRDSFTLPKTELLQIAAMKKRALELGVDVKKSELIRAGLQALSGMADASFKKAMASIPTIKTGRPAKD